MSKSRLFLIDASAWIEVMRGTATAALKEQVTGLLESGNGALSEPVWLELERGVRGKKETERLASIRQLCTWLEFSPACWEKANQIAKTCTRAGVNVPLGDILVAGCARAHSVELVEQDRHFEMIDRAMS